MAATPTDTPLPPTEVSFQLSWTHEYSVSGFYAAELNGHFARQNLKVTLEEGGFVEGRYIEPTDKVLSGEAAFGLGSAASILQARAQGRPVVAIASILQRSPTGLISLKGSNIQQPQDLIGKTVAVSDGGAAQLLDVLFISQGIDLTQINIIPRTDFGVDPLLDGSVDALVGWIINEGVAVKEAGSEPSFMLFSDYGIPDYSTLIFTSEDMINHHPDVVQRFLNASIAGFADVVKDPEDAVTATLKYNGTLDYDKQLNRLEASIPLIQPARAKVGLMDAATWENVHRILRDAEILTTDVDVRSAFNMSFLNTLYTQ